MPDEMVLESPPDAAATRRAGLAGHSDLLLNTWRPPPRSRAHQADELAEGTGTDAEEGAAIGVPALLARCRPLPRAPKRSAGHARSPASAE
ncbi:hypothetical protein SVIO_083460 [Streptomyces violaceusniger]|uniref:Uncharacterized protein n=1 Tax=Streptomyces violaceusniger TaxID=68280 RepID=A0A4D4LI00_STRVO|nr:hypothetical protein SVIO_083460 [Streptomyces violaceusniger]